MSKTVAQLEAELAELEREHDSIGPKIAELEGQAKDLENRRRDLRDWRDMGLIYRKQIELAARRQADRFESGVKVQVRSSWGDAIEEWAFLKITKKRIYLQAKEGRERWFHLDGTSPYWGTIEPESLAKLIEAKK